MFFFNKLVRTDLILVLAALFVLLLHNNTWKSIFAGFFFATLLISIFNHIEYYRKIKKWY
jgi:hypothetical protein